MAGEKAAALAAIDDLTGDVPARGSSSKGYRYRVNAGGGSVTCREVLEQLEELRDLVDVIVEDA